MGPNSLSDIANSRPTRSGLELPLEQVGMEKINTQILVRDGKGILQKTAALVNAYVSLNDGKARGIHMSRLFKLVTEMSGEEISSASLFRTLDEMLTSHKDISQSAYLDVKFDYLIERKALISESVGWRSYPVRMRAQNQNGEKSFKLNLSVEYSSTCPCSAALSREAIQEQFASDFAGKAVNLDEIHAWLGKEASYVATPHAQRSEANVQFEFSQGASADLVQLIDTLELALGTPVQAAVKREDEQEFARLNGQNLMFCEDAARKLKAALLARPDLKDFQIEVRHFESLHAHEAVARCSKQN